MSAEVFACPCGFAPFAKVLHRHGPILSAISVETGKCEDPNHLPPEEIKESAEDQHPVGPAREA